MLEPIERNLVTLGRGNGEPIQDVLTPVATPVSSLERAAEFLAEPGVFGLDSLRTIPADSGTKGFEIAGLLAQWRAASVAIEDRALVLRSPEEGTRPGGVFFYSIEAPAGVRPRLRLTYATRVPFGLP